MRHGSLHKKERYKEMVKPECFYRFEEKDSSREIQEDRGYKARVVNWGNLAGPSLRLL